MTTAGMFSRLDGPVSFALPLRALAVLGLLLGLCCVLLIVSLMAGSYPLGALDVVATLTGRPPSEMAQTVVWQFRFPRTLAALAAGALLALSGAALQNVTRNPLADPSLVGVSQGAGLAVVAAIVVWPDLPQALRPLLAFGGALAVAALIQGIAMRRTGGATMRFILTGIGIAAFISALTSAFLTYGQIDRAVSALGWLAGSVHAAGWSEAGMLAGTLLCLVPALFAASRPMAAMRMGQDVAVGLGLKVGRTRAALITLSVALAASAVAMVGPLGFVGLVAPHIAHRLARSGVGLHLALSAAAGAALVGAADLVGRVAFAPVQIPAGLVTAILGVPIFVWLILRTQARPA
ncbi:iron(III) dicitrate transport system permease protein [Oceanicola granulosus HTCC2516]|uniref:Iron(III) dicitrate transport system permease protein n=1 Tax=Oceanicola granulosus (strain ATCC BAA-861 / DSM 15982 / KCTC 12143 / HTCC2516) TaxID=314256 RepID=Q2CF56_OCEGH|nr:iron ABC transporter permease [Oceanicola granulosus]EAR51271.1 iron(III) dicitrate transport system permease protein [Oceanicola granulosus HTCC2516]